MKKVLIYNYLSFAGMRFAGLIVFSMIGLIILYAMYGQAVLIDPAALTSGDPKYLTGLKIFQILSPAGLFLAPPLLLAT